MAREHEKTQGRPEVVSEFFTLCGLIRVKLSENFTLWDFAQGKSAEFVGNGRLAQILHTQSWLTPNGDAPPMGARGGDMDRFMRILARTFVVCAIAGGLGLTAWSIMLTIGPH